MFGLNNTRGEGGKGGICRQMVSALRNAKWSHGGDGLFVDVITGCERY